MIDLSPPLACYLRLLAARQAWFLVPLVFAFAATHMLPGFALPGALALAALGAVAAGVDLSCFALVPMAPADPEARRAARVVAIAAGAAVGFVGLTSVAAPSAAWLHLMLILTVKLAVAGGFAAVAWPAFRDDVWPLVSTLGEDSPALADALAERAALRGEEHRQLTAGRAAAEDARRRVLTFFGAHLAALQPRIDPAWLEAEVRSQIPDDGTPQESYAAAGKLLGQMAGVLREQKQQQEALDAQVEAIRAAREALLRPGAIDPEVRDEELADLDRREQQLLARRAAARP